MRRNYSFGWYCCLRVRKFSAFPAPCVIRNFSLRSTSPQLIFSTFKIRINDWFRIFYFEFVMLLDYPYRCMLVSLFCECMSLLTCADSLKIQCSCIYSTQKVIILVNYQSSTNGGFVFQLKQHVQISVRFHSCFGIL